MGTDLEHDGLDSLAPRWIVVNTHAHREHIALDNLHRQAHHAYCPMIRKRRSHARRIDAVLRPLFPSYLFVEIKPELVRWRPILSTYGVRSIVRAGAMPSTIDGAFIANLRAREVDGAVVRPPSPYQIGQQVQIADGPFDRLIATIIDMDEKDRLVVLLDMMNRRIKVTLKSESVTLA
jgi:transcriptional antiterminator RfaH